MARLDTKPVEGNWEIDWQDYDKSSYEKQLNDLIDTSDQVDVTKTLVGVVISFQVADGYAYYRVSKDKPLTLQHIPFCDAYQVHPATIRGLGKQDIVATACFQKAIRNLALLK